LASNSLLEALVFGARLAEDLRERGTLRLGRGTLPTPERFHLLPPPKALREAMTRLVGLERNAEGLNEALRIIAQIERAGGHEPTLLNMTATAKLVVSGALARRESRGSHFRTDYPQTDATGVRTFMTLARAEQMIAEPQAVASARSRA